MKDFFTKYWKTLLFFGLVGLVGGFFTGIYMLDSYPVEMRQQILTQGLTPITLGLVTAMQSAGYGIVLGAAGIWLGKKIGLCFCDCSTGEVHLTQLEGEDLSLRVSNELGRFNPSEILVNSFMAANPVVQEFVERRLNVPLEQRPDEEFDGERFVNLSENEPLTFTSTLCSIGTFCVTSDAVFVTVKVFTTSLFWITSIWKLIPFLSVKTFAIVNERIPQPPAITGDVRTPLAPTLPLMQIAFLLSETVRRPK